MFFLFLGKKKIGVNLYMINFVRLKFKHDGKKKKTNTWFQKLKKLI